MNTAKHGFDEEISGRDRLINAALELAAIKRSFADIGVRELTRAADLSPGAFYRHFADMDSLGQEVIHSVDRVLRVALTEAWDELEDISQVSRLSLRAYFRLVRRHENAFVVCARERYGASTTLRRAMQKLQQGLARDLARSLAHTPVFARLPLANLEAAALDVVEQVNIRMLDYVVADPGGRRDVRQSTERFVRCHFAGLLVTATATKADPSRKAA
nr:TetR family transcriptional regulator [Oceanococcus sp. HetDA_MAG_MS8]